MYDGGHAFDLQVVALYSFATLTHKFPLSDAARGCRPYQLEVIRTAYQRRRRHVERISNQGKVYQ